MESGRELNVDFASLAIRDPAFEAVYHDGRIDFHDPLAVQQLTKTILKENFGLIVELPQDRLCPPVPVRYEYIRWIQDLLDTTSDGYTDSYEPEREVIGFDIGVGASCIYPLLGCSTRPRWRFGGTDIDAQNYSYAARNIGLNKLSSRIRLRQTQSTDPLINLSALGIKQADVVMCNPPFFTSREDMLSTYTTKEKGPSAVCTGAAVEMVTEGGDLGFVLRMIEESEKLKERVQWYSSMLGKLSSVNEVVNRLKEKGIGNWAVTCLMAGKVTRRWVVAWSFGDLRPRNDVARRNMIVKNVLPFPTELKVHIANGDETLRIEQLNKTMDTLDVKWIWNTKDRIGLCFAKENVWSRSARRLGKRRSIPEKQIVVMNMDEDNADDEVVALGVKINLIVSERELIVRWLQGTDSVLLESFCGMLNRQLNRNDPG